MPGHYKKKRKKDNGKKGNSCKVEKPKVREKVQNKKQK